MLRLAEEVKARHGVPDLAVDSVSIELAASLLDVSGQVPAA
ncbi:hypothetical protein [Amycolatopsis magusensis]|uniref:Uncharacterized protein n=1 Tax=Amycolatopsis magusensis TaxID=882444 RepID=A0ABS4PVH1_9PSEU|nr:hypothetical protein [Amycolatopsis magusensis]MBP2182844.1 hypothetical protein [Amycolatopsis magusensis]